jgi:hypothetical protein
MRPALEKSLAMQRAIGMRTEILEPGDVGRVEPRVDPAGLGLYEPESGTAIPPRSRWRTRRPRDGWA